MTNHSLWLGLVVIMLLLACLALSVSILVQTVAGLL